MEVTAEAAQAADFRLPRGALPASVASGLGRVVGRDRGANLQQKIAPALRTRLHSPDSANMVDLSPSIDAG